MVALNEYQVQIGDSGLLMGPGTPITVKNIEGLVDRDPRTDDTDRVRADGAVLGPDYANPKTVTLTLRIRGTSAADALATYETIRAAWNSVRLTEGGQATTSLRWRLPGQVARRLEGGRPRRIGLDLSTVATRNLVAVATFYAPDPRELADAQRVIDINYGSALTLPNAGNHPASVWWDVYGQATNPALIRDEAARFDLTTAIGPGDFYRLRTDPKTVTRASDAGNLYQVFSGTWLEVPPGGAVFRAVKDSGSGLRVRATYRDTWL